MPAFFTIVVDETMRFNLERIAEREKMSVSEVIHHFLMLGLVEDTTGPFCYYDKESGETLEMEVFPHNVQEQHP